MKGGGHTGAMTGGIVATAIVVWPAAPFFLFMHGKDTTIPKGTEITAYVNGVMPLDPAKFAPTAPPASTVPSSTAPSAQTTTTNAQLEITSNPSGAEISVDGDFVGDTPSELAIATGVHTITISKHGFKAWERKLTISSGKVTVAADLEAGDQSVANLKIVDGLVRKANLLQTARCSGELLYENSAGVYVIARVSEFEVSCKVVCSAFHRSLGLQCCG